MNPTVVLIKRNIIYVFNAIIFRQKYVIERIFCQKTLFAKQSTASKK